jgi:hypothetical protein
VRLIELKSPKEKRILRCTRRDLRHAQPLAAFCESKNKAHAFGENRVNSDLNRPGYSPANIGKPKCSGAYQSPK